MKDLDLSNAEGLDESITEDYSNAKGWFKAAVKNVTSTVKSAGQSVGGAVKAAGQNISSTTKDIGKNISSTTKDIGQNIKSTTKDLGKNISANTQRIKDNAKKLTDKAKDAAQKMRDKIKETENRIGKKLKKITKKLKDIVDKFQDKFKNALRKTMRNLILKSIRGNIHGLATKMFAAIGTADEVKAKKIKASFVSKAKKAYASTLAQWKKLGGSESELNDAIRTGSSKKMLKNPFNRADGNNHDEFYSYIASEDYYYGVDGDDDELAKAEAEKIKADEEAAVVINEDDATLEVPDEEEKVSGFKAFIAKIISFFKRNKGDENPYEEGDPAADDFANQEKADEGNQPEGEGDGTVLDELLKDDASKEEDSDDDSKKSGEGDDKILGMPKGVAIGLGVVLVAVGGFVAYKYFKGKK